MTLCCEANILCWHNVFYWTWGLSGYTISSAHWFPGLLWLIWLPRRAPLSPSPLHVCPYQSCMLSRRTRSSQREEDCSSVRSVCGSWGPLLKAPHKLSRSMCWRTQESKTSKTPDISKWRAFWGNMAFLTISVVYEYIFDSWNVP